MAWYSYLAADGSTIEREFEMSNAPKIGSKIRVKGKTYTRVVDTGTHGVVRPNADFVDYTLPKFYPGAKRHTKDGKPIFTSRKDARECAAWASHNDVPLTYDSL